MDCPRCDAKTRTLESRRADGGQVMRRRRECTGCGNRFTTFERREHEPAFVIKRGGERQAFDRVKLRASLMRAAHKRPVSPADIERLVDQIETEAEEAGGNIDAARVGERCLDGLRVLDVGAWLQFIGVYRQLTDLDSVRAELDRIERAANSGNSPGPQAADPESARKHRVSAAGSVRTSRDDVPLPTHSD